MKPTKIKMFDPEKPKQRKFGLLRYCNYCTMISDMIAEIDEAAKRLELTNETLFPRL